jgi:hypothetical protein
MASDSVEKVSQPDQGPPEKDEVKLGITISTIDEKALVKKIDRQCG